MIKQLLEDPEFWKQASQSPVPPTTPEQQQQVYLGLIDGFKAAGCNPAMVAGFLEAIMENSPLYKEAAPTPVTAPAFNVQDALQGGGWAGKNPALFEQIRDTAIHHPDAMKWLGGALKEYNAGGGGWGGIGNVIKSEAGPAITSGYNYLKDNAAQWSPYVMSGLGSMAAAKMMGSSNMGAVGAGVAGGYLGGRAITGQPIVQPIKDMAGKVYDEGKDFVNKHLTSQNPTDPSNMTASTSMEADRQLPGIQPVQQPQSNLTA